MYILPVLVSHIGSPNPVMFGDFVFGHFVEF